MQAKKPKKKLVCKTGRSRCLQRGNFRRRVLIHNDNCFSPAMEFTARLERGKQVNY
jgi:hypothetical protein